MPRSTGSMPGSHAPLADGRPEAVGDGVARADRSPAKGGGLDALGVGDLVTEAHSFRTSEQVRGARRPAVAEVDRLGGPGPEEVLQRLGDRERVDVVEHVLEAEILQGDPAVTPSGVDGAAHDVVGLDRTAEAADVDACSPVSWPRPADDRAGGVAVRLLERRLLSGRPAPGRGRAGSACR